jgi:hypothetical protein
MADSKSTSSASETPSQAAPVEQAPKAAPKAEAAPAAPAAAPEPDLGVDEVEEAPEYYVHPRYVDDGDNSRLPPALRPCPAGPSS